jgi:hypothetical protein
VPGGGVAEQTPKPCGFILFLFSFSFFATRTWTLVQVPQPFSNSVSTSLDLKFAKHKRISCLHAFFIFYGRTDEGQEPITYVSYKIAFKTKRREFYRKTKKTVSSLKALYHIFICVFQMYVYFERAVLMVRIPLCCVFFHFFQKKKGGFSHRNQRHYR